MIITHESKWHDLSTAIQGDCANRTLFKTAGFFYVLIWSSLRNKQKWVIMKDFRLIEIWEILSFSRQNVYDSSKGDGHLSWYMARYLKDWFEPSVGNLFFIFFTFLSMLNLSHVLEFTQNWYKIWCFKPDLLFKIPTQVCKPSTSL